MTAAALVAEDVTVRYRRDAEAAIQNVSLEIPDGGCVGIVGESGSGKSTLARVLVRERLATSGDVRVFGRSWRDIPERGPVRRSVQMIFQDPYGALNPRMTPLAAVSEAVTVARGTRGREARRVAEDLLAEVGLSGALLRQSPRSLSGGQRQRVVIARALACEPRVLVADEPTSALDVSVQAQILNLFMRLRAERGVALVLISHDIAVVEHLADHVAVMLGGRIVEVGVTEQVLHAPLHDYTRRLLDAFRLDAAPEPAGRRVET